MSVPPTWDLAAVLRPVRRAERRIRLARALRVSVTVLACALVAAIVVVSLRKVGWIDERTTRGVLIALAGSWFAVTVGAYVRRLAPSAGAVALDRHHGLADRLSSAIEFAAVPGEERTAFMDAAIADALEHAPRVDPRRAVSLRWTQWSRDVGWAAGLLAVLGAVLLFEIRTRQTIASARTIDAMEVTADDLDAVREFLKEMEQKPLGEDTKAAIAEFNQLVDDLAQKRLDRTEAFRKLQSLEDKLLDGREANTKDLEEALAKIGEELKKADATRPAGEALEKKNLAEASEKLRELAKKLKQEGGKFDQAQLEKIRDALKKAASSQDSRKAALDKRREELQKDLLKQKQKQGDAGTDDEKSLLKKKERELERLDREKEQQEKTDRQLDRLDRELAKAAEDLMRDLGASADDIEKSAEDLNRMAREKMSDQEKEQLRQRLQELRETLRQQGKGGKQQMARLQRFQQRARGAGKPGQQGEQSGEGEEGQKPGQGQPGQEGEQGEGEQGKDGKGQKGQEKGQGKGQGQGETWVMGPGGQRMLMLSKGQGGQGTQPGGGGDKPGQGAGSERGGNPQGAATNLKGQTQDTQIAGQDTGEGSSRSEVIQGAAERGFASRGYTKVYREYQNVAEESLNHDDIPGGYRFYVRRYFLLIRPRDNP